jgi:hypothetical protein
VSPATDGYHDAHARRLFGVDAACSLGLSATSQQYFSLRTNQPPTISQQYFSLRTNQHQPSATSQTNRLLDARGTSFIKRRLFQMISSLDNVLPLGLKSQQVK